MLPEQRARRRPHGARRRGHRLEAHNDPGLQPRPRDDHIAPLPSVFKVGRHLGGDTRLVVAESGHVAGIVNPPAAARYGYWTHDAEAETPGGLACRGDPAFRLLVARLALLGCVRGPRAPTLRSAQLYGLLQ
jgi:hypothetical protein